MAPSAQLITQPPPGQSSIEQVEPTAQSIVQDPSTQVPRRQVALSAHSIRQPMLQVSTSQVDSPEQLQVQPEPHAPVQEEAFSHWT